MLIKMKIRIYSAPAVEGLSPLFEDNLSYNLYDLSNNNKILIV